MMTNAKTKQDVRIIFKLIVAAVIMILLGNLIISIIFTSIISTAHDLRFYEQATKIDDSETFELFTKNESGNALAYGIFSAINPVQIPELSGEYFAIERTIQQYQENTRQAGGGDDGSGWYYETYHSWDVVGTETFFANNLSFLGNMYSSNKFREYSFEDINIDEECSLAVQDKIFYSNSDHEKYYYPIEFGDNLGNIRYSYRIVPAEFDGTIFVNVDNESIQNAFDCYGDNGKTINIYLNKTINDVISSVRHENVIAKIILWIGWIIFYVVAILLFSEKLFK